jgi:hypothetical protein
MSGKVPKPPPPPAPPPTTGGAAKRIPNKNAGRYREGRASTILGGSLGSADTQMKTLLGE